MRICELKRPVIDVYELGLLDAQKFLHANPHIITESQSSEIEYRKLIDAEKKHTINTPLTVNRVYYPLQLTGIPIGQYISARTADNVTFVKYYNNRLLFNSHTSSDIIFPANDAKIGDQCIDILIYSNIDERDQFLSMLKLSLDSWHFFLNKV